MAAYHLGKGDRMRYITYRGKTQCVAHWARELGIPEGTIRRRMERTADPSILLNTHIATPSEAVRGSWPRPPAGRMITYLGKTMNIGQWSRELNLAPSTIRCRMSRTDDPGKILSTHIATPADAGRIGGSRSPWGRYVPRLNRKR